MDERTKKRIEDVDYIRAKKYFSEDVQAPDPYDRSVSTRFWKYSLRIWDKELKARYYRGEPPDMPTYPCYLVRMPCDEGHTLFRCVFTQPCATSPELETVCA